MEKLKSFKDLEQVKADIKSGEIVGRKGVFSSIRDEIIRQLRPCRGEWVYQAYLLRTVKEVLVKNGTFTTLSPRMRANYCYNSLYYLEDQKRIERKKVDEGGTIVAIVRLK